MPRSRHAPVTAAQKGGVLGVGGDAAGVGRWIACGPTFYLLIEGRTNGFFVGSLIAACHDASRSSTTIAAGYAMSGLIIDATALRGTDTCVASMAGCSAFWSKKNTIASLVTAKLW